jgi:tetratricopeptide (TPR) repeat protein
VEQLPESPLANHLHGMVLHRIGRVDDAIQYAWTAATKDDEAIGLWVNLATYLVDAKRTSEALEVGNYLSTKWPDDESAILCAARCLCLNECFNEADLLLQKLLGQSFDDADALLLAIEVSARRSDLDEAASRFRKFVEVYVFSAQWLAENAKSPIFGPVLLHGMLKGIYGSRGTEFNYSQAIKWFLSPHAPKDFFLPPSLPGNMLQGAAETFLKGVSRDEIVCFIDDTFWDTGKNGLALTKNSLRWKAMLGDACVVKYSAITSISMDLDDSTITFGAGDQPMELACHNVAFAEGMYRFLTAAAFAFR